MTTQASKRNLMKAVLIVTAFSLFVVACLKQEAPVKPVITAESTPDPVAVKAADSNFDKFDHKVKEHQQFACTQCHQREGKSRDLKYAGHESCIGCHLNQFTNSDKAMCAICHDKLDAVPPSVKAFPATFIEGFNMKFDHAAHSRGEGRPAEGCVACHDPRGPGKSIPAGIDAHANCYSCHTAESKIGSCNVCHVIAPYNRTPPSRYVFKAVFSHATHGPAQGVSCDDCHSVRAGASQGGQVTTIIPDEHCGQIANTCANCHNGSRAFTGRDPYNMGSCARCHGSTFNMLPGDPCRGR